MTISVTHPFVSAIPDGGDATLVQPSNWNAGHTISQATARLLGRTTAGTGSTEEITVGTGLSLAAGALTCTVSPVSDVFKADAPNSDFDLTNGGIGGAVTILSKSITGITAKDGLTLEIWYTMLNTSGGSVNVTPVISLGGVNMNSAGTIVTFLSNATNKTTGHLLAAFSVSASNLTNMNMSLMFPNATSAAGAGAALGSGVANSQQLHNTTTTDLTGTQTLLFTLASSSVTTTQTFTLNSWSIRKVSSNP